ncbi:MAG: hypothetical protein KDI20_14275 [Pseudomonadales bacterium]|nr:hypothetical protein [Pseudomonadales bacterium]
MLETSFALTSMWLGMEAEFNANNVETILAIGGALYLFVAGLDNLITGWLQLPKNDSKLQDSDEKSPVT